MGIVTPLWGQIATACDSSLWSHVYHPLASWSSSSTADLLDTATGNVWALSSMEGNRNFWLVMPRISNMKEMNEAFPPKK